MKQHPELIYFRKCPTCGYSELDSESYSKNPNIYKYATYNMLMGFEEVTQTKEEPCSTTSSQKE